jgi:hypothetical protein
MGLTGAELDALAREGIPQPTETKMDKLMKIIMGGWIPVEKRTQWVAMGMFVVALTNGLLAWGGGDAGMADFLGEMQKQWELIAGSFGLYFLGEKVDNKAKK